MFSGRRVNLIAFVKYFEYIFCVKVSMLIIVIIVIIIIISRSNRSSSSCSSRSSSSSSTTYCYNNCCRRRLSSSFTQIIINKSVCFVYSCLSISDSFSH